MEDLRLKIEDLRLAERKQRFKIEDVRWKICRADRVLDPRLREDDYQQRPWKDN